jgi:hypothetical protein
MPHHLQVYPNDVNLLEHNIDTIKNIETLIGCSRDGDLVVNTLKTKYSVCCCLVTRMAGKIIT